jgi:hypothetical protein
MSETRKSMFRVVIAAPIDRVWADNLKAIVETGRPTPGGRFALLMMKLAQPFTPAAARSENWPL